MAYVGTPTNLGSNQATLASIIYGEAGNQGTVGMQAVGAVIANRANANLNGYGSDVMSQALAPNQFQGQSSAFNSTAWQVAGNVLNGTNPDPTGGALYYANPGASSAAWARNLNSSNSLQIGDHFFTDNTNGTPFVPNTSGSGSTIATGPADNSSGGTDSVTMNSADPNYGDITGYSVAGVNAPMPSTSTGSGVAPGASSAVTSGTNAPNTNASAQGTPIQTALQPEETSFITSTVQGIEKAFGSGTQAVITAAENAVGTWLGSLQNWFSRAFLIIVGIIIVAVALAALMWDHGGKETVIQMGRAAAA